MQIKASVGVAIAISTLCGFLAAPQALAAVVNFQYGTSITPSPINPTASLPAQGSIVNQSGIGSFPAPTGASYNAAVNGILGADITVGSVSVTDLGVGAYADIYGPTPIAVNLALRDIASGSVGLFSFTGLLSGQVSSDGTSAAAAFDNPFTAASQIQTIGSNTYDVKIIPTKDFSSPGSPPSGGTGLQGLYSFNVSQVVPEPASAALVAMGLGFLVSNRRCAARRQG